MENTKMKKNVIGIVGNSIPEEIFQAAGFATMRLTDVISDNASFESFFPSQSCLFCKKAEKMVSDIHNSLKGVVFASSCTAMEKLYEVFKKESRLDIVEIFDIPKVINKHSIHFFRNRVNEFVKRLETKYSVRVETDALFEAIKLNNRLRKRLKEKRIYRSFIFKNNPISLDNLSEKIKYLNLLVENRQPPPKIILVGSRFQEDIIAEAFKEEGGNASVFLTDDGDYFNNIIIQEDIDPFDAIVNGCLEVLKWGQNITKLPDIEVFKELIKEEDIKGIVTLSYPFCAKTNYDIAWLKKNKEALNVPIIYIQIDNIASVSAGLRNRINAFIETIGEEYD